MPQHVYVATDPDGDLIAVSTDIDGLHAPIFRGVDNGPDGPITKLVYPSDTDPDLVADYGADVTTPDFGDPVTVATVRRVDLTGSADTAALSNTSQGGRTLTWAEVHESDRATISDLRARLVVLDDLDRCEHGRHHKDVCNGCGGPSHGNPHARPGEPIGYTMSGVPYVWPTGLADYTRVESWQAR